MQTHNVLEGKASILRHSSKYIRFYVLQQSMSRFQTFEGVLVRIVSESSLVKRFFISLKSEERGNFVFVSGQNLVLSIPGAVDEKNRVIKRVFSIASTPSDELIELCIAINPAPSFSNTLASLSEGSTLFVEGPFGQFVLSPPKERVSFIAGGTGIAPLLCMIRSLIKQGFSGRMDLLFGFRTAQDYLYRSEIEEYSKRNVQLTASASRDGNWQGLKGRITQFLVSAITNTGQEVYVCGPPDMVKQTLVVLKRIGFTDTQIKKEQW